MKNRFFCTALTVLAVIVATPAWTQETPSVPAGGGGMPSGRSAKMAARLKYYPPNNYLKHYLGDDRYKIAGGVWKVVSTQLDTYYHRPNCPNMLRQHADIVIGFSHSKDAEEAGYRADGVCRPKEETVIYGQAPGLTTDYLSRALSLTLAEGSATVTLPAQWRRTASQSMDVFGLKMSVDSFKRKNSNGEVSIVAFRPPGGVSGEAYLQQHMGQQANHSGNSGNKAFWEGFAATNPQMRAGNSVATPKKIKFSGTTAYSMNIPIPARRRGNTIIKATDMNLIAVGKGAKAYAIIDSDRSKSARSLVNSFR